MCYNICRAHYNQCLILGSGGVNVEIRQQKTSKTVKITESEQIFLNVISYGVGIITAIIALLAYTIVDLMGGE